MSRFFGLSNNKCKNSKSKNRRSFIETLEKREVLTTTLFLDFGTGLGIGNSLDLTVAEIREIDGAALSVPSAPSGFVVGTGPNLARTDDPGTPANETVLDTDVIDFTPLSIDFDQSGGSPNNADVDALADAVIAIARRALEPFDIDVELGLADDVGTIADIQASFDANNADATGEFDSYVFVMDTTSNGQRFNGGSVGDAIDDDHINQDGQDGLGLFGIAAGGDLFRYFFGDDTGNNQDEMALVFAENILANTTAPVDPNDSDDVADFHDRLAHRLAYTAVHEALHTFGILHTEQGVAQYLVDQNFYLFDDLVAEAQLSDGDGVRVGSVSRETNNIVTRFGLLEDVTTVSSSTVSQPTTGGTYTNNYDVLANSAGDIGLRDDDNDGRPDLAYVTGTGANDLIQLTLDPLNEGIVDVTITPFSDTARQTQVERYNSATDQYDLLTLEYEIRIEDLSSLLLAETEGTILIDSSLGNDRIEIDAGIAADFRIRTLLGDDEIVVMGSNTPQLRSFVVEGEAGDDELIFDYSSGSPLPAVGYEFAYDGGLGTDSTSVIDSGSNTRAAFFVDSKVTTDYSLSETPYISIASTLIDAADSNTNDGVADASSTLAGDQITLRAAIQEANAATGPAYVFLPSSTQSISLGDLDITNEVNIIGAGAGLSLIDSGGLSNNVSTFELATSTSDLDLSRITLSGGYSDTGHLGKAINLTNEASIEISDSSIVDYRAAMNGVAIRAVASDVNIRNSVFTNNTSNGFTNGGIFVSGNSQYNGSLTIGGTAFVNNTGSNQELKNVWLGSGVNIYNAGNNLVDQPDTSVEAGNFFSAADNLTDHFGTPDYLVTSAKDTFNSTPDNNLLSLREAVQLSNVNSGAEEIWLPAWDYPLTLTGTESTADNSVNDLDVLGSTSILGAGPGMTVIDVGGLASVTNHMDNRAFHLDGSSSDLDISRLTLTGGNNPFGTNGDAFLVENSATLILTDSAVVGNKGMANGVGIRSKSGHVTVRRSVFTNNESTHNTAAAIFATQSTSDPGSLKIGDSIFALNTAAQMTTYANIWIGSTVTKDNEGNNLFDEIGGGFYDSGIDFQGTPDHVVTSVEDTFNAVPDPNQLSVREAISQANATSNQEVWLPAWDFILTRDRASYGGGSLTDIDTAFGDLDISNDMTIRGVLNETSVRWKTGINDAVFDLLGDYNNDGQADYDNVSAADYTIWRDIFDDANIDPSTDDESLWKHADGDDDGDIDDDDRLIWVNHYGNTLALHDIDTF